MSAKAKRAVKPSEMLIKVNRRDAIAAAEEMYEVVEAFGNSLKANNPTQKFCLEIMDGVHMLEEDYEQCAACQGTSVLEALEYDPLPATLEAVKRLLDRGVYEADKRAKRLISSQMVYKDQDERDDAVKTLKDLRNQVVKVMPDGV